LKIEIPNTTAATGRSASGPGHAFILRRFDTQAISATTMFKAAFPSASSDHETAEMKWVRTVYDVSGNNGSKNLTNIPRLAGVWLSPADALSLAEDYTIAELVQVIASAVPDPNTNYRRSKGATPSKPSPAPTVPSVTPTSDSVIPATLPPLSTTSSSPVPVPPAKRRKEASPVPSPQPPSAKAPRRSTRATKSPPPSRNYASFTSQASTLTQVRAKTPTRSSKKSIPDPPTPVAGSDETAVDDEAAAVLDVAAGEELRKQDFEEQQQLISRLKAQQPDNMVFTDKREREDDDGHINMNFKEPETEKRVIASNRRIRGVKLDTKQKSFAWGIAAFAVSFGAV
jgi:hypothetical protein